MTIANRRSILQLTAAMGAGALTGAASAAAPAAGAKPLFDVPRITIPIVGSDAVQRYFTMTGECAEAMRAKLAQP